MDGQSPVGWLADLTHRFAVPEVTSEIVGDDALAELLATEQR
jgi:hypothetical protein